MPLVHAFAVWLCPSKLELAAICGFFFYDNLNMEENIRVLFSDNSTWYAGTTHKWTAVTLQPCPEVTLERPWWKKTFSVQKFKQRAWNIRTAFQTSVMDKLGWQYFRGMRQWPPGCVTCSKSETSTHCYFSNNLWNPEFLGVGWKWEWLFNLFTLNDPPTKSLLTMSRTMSCGSLEEWCFH